MVLLSILVGLTTSSLAQVSDSAAEIKLGLGVFHEYPTVSVKYAEAGYIKPLQTWFSERYSAGFWLDRQSITTAVFNYQVGWMPQIEYTYLGIFSGPALITATDDRLSSPFQFKTTFMMGVEDPYRRRIGISYDHISNASITQPNLGRDFITLTIGIGL